MLADVRATIAVGANARELLCFYQNTSTAADREMRANGKNNLSLKLITVLCSGARLVGATGVNCIQIPRRIGRMHSFVCVTRGSNQNPKDGLQEGYFTPYA